MKTLSMFSWGFAGWGNATAELVAAVDAAETKRGFNPPIFVDIRYKRTGRAKGFKEHTFEDLLGWRRYRWMPTLGNRAIATGKRKTDIAAPKAARNLLDVALEASDKRVRVIFFCACPSPFGTRCHRHEVTKLLRREARLRAIPLEVSEWPGGQPSARPFAMRVPPSSIPALLRGRSSVPLHREKVPAALVGIPWGTIVRLKSAGEELLVPVGPAAYRSGSWVLPMFLVEDAEKDVRGLRRQTAKLRRLCELD